MAHSFREGWQEMISAQILAAKSFYDQESSATSQKLFSEPMTIINLSRIKYGMQQSLEPFNPLLQHSNISVENGNEIVMRNDYSEYPLLG